VLAACETDWAFQADKSGSVSAKFKQWGCGNRSQLKVLKVKQTAHSEHDTKKKPAKTPITEDDSYGFSSFHLLSIYFLHLFPLTGPLV
jgi:hypothetical protein